MVSVAERCRSGRIHRAGFTIIELVIIVLIVGIMAAVATPRFASSLHRMRAEAAAKRIKVDLEFARQTAISQSLPQLVSFNPALETYSIPGLPDLNHPSQTYAVALDSSPYNAALVSASLGGDSNVQFDRFGKPDSGGTITVQAGGYQQTVTINPATGRSSVP